MKYITLRVPAPFSDGPQYDEEGELIPGSWPIGLPHEDMQGWQTIGKANGGLELCEFVADDDWPIKDLPSGWRATASYIWDTQTPHRYGEEGVLIESAYDAEMETDEDDYMKHFPDDTEYRRHHTYAGWPAI